MSDTFWAGVAGFVLAAIATILVVAMFRTVYYAGYSNAMDCVKYQIRCS